MNITADRKPDPSPEKASGKRTHHASAAALLLLALSALASGLPRLIGATHEMAAQDVIKALLSEHPLPLPPEALTEAERELAAADHWVPGAEVRLDRGLILTHRALNAPPPEQAAIFAAAERATAEGLAVSPGEPGGWARLAWLRRRSGDIAGATAALRMSFLSGAFVPPLMQSRLELGLALQPAMDEEMLSLLRRQVRLTWISSPEFVAKLAERPDAGPLARNALAELSEQEVARYLERHGSKQ